TRGACACERTGSRRSIRTHPCGSVFFFSSRRRHTRSDRDWSSDVCSSDLSILASRPVTLHRVPRLRDVDTLSLLLGHLGVEVKRSEERRVGKECRSRGSPYH